MFWLIRLQQETVNEANQDLGNYGDPDEQTDPLQDVRHFRLRTFIPHMSFDKCDTTKRQA